MKYFWLVVLILTSVLLTNASAQTRIFVTSTDDGTGGPECRLRDAITAANVNTPTGGCAFHGTGSSYIVELGKKRTYKLLFTGLPAVSGNVTIEGNGSIITRGSDGTAGPLLEVAFRGVLTVNNLTVFRGLAGGIKSGIESILSVVNSTVTGNTNSGSASGGGIDVEFGDLYLVNSTITGNSSTGFGAGGGVGGSGGFYYVTNSTFSGNFIVPAPFPSGPNQSPGGNNISVVFWLDPGQPQIFLKNTIVVNTAAGVSCYGPHYVPSDVSGPPTFAASSNLYSGSDCEFYPAEAGSLINADAKLQPLANNGGPTQTMALGAGSTAINAGDPAVCAALPVNGFDQRGLLRRVGFCDIGAFEAQPFDVDIVSGSPQETFVNTPFAEPLEVIVKDFFSNPLGGAEVDFVLSHGNGPSAVLSTPVAASAIDGTASTTAVANGKPGTYRIKAEAGAGHAAFRLANRKKSHGERSGDSD